MHVYEATVAVPGYEDRFVRIEVNRLNPDHPRVYADGPTNSPHRWPDRNSHRLCIWDPNDSAELLWVPDDGLLVLFAMATRHLFQECWWREHGEWLGPEAPHGPALSQTSTTHPSGPAKESS